MSAHEITRPSTIPSANDSRFTQRLRVFELTYRLRNGHVGMLTTVARNSSLAIDHLATIYGDSLRGVKPLQVL